MGERLTRVVRSPFTVAVLVLAAFGALLSVAADREAPGTAPPAVRGVVATVNGQPLPRAVLDRAFQKIAEHYVRFGPGLPLARMWSYRLEAFSQAVDEHLVSAEACAQGIAVSADEVEEALDEIVTQHVAQLRGRGGDLEKRLAERCAELGGPSQPTMGETEFRDWLKEWLGPRYGEEVKATLTMERLKPEVVPLAPVSDDDVRAQFATVTLRTIEIRYGPAERLEQAEAAAEERAEELLRQIRNGADFAALASQTSEDERSRVTGRLETAALVSSLNPDRQKAVASLAAGEVSDSIRTDRGYEIIRLEERGYDLPSDYEERKPQLTARLAAEQQEHAWQKHVEALHDEADITLTDPELLAYRCLEDGKEEEALVLLEEASEHAETLGPSGATSVFFKLGAHYSVLERWEEATDAYASCNHYVSQVLDLFPEGRVSALLGLGHTYENLSVQLRQRGQVEQAEEASREAVKHYRDTGRHSGNPSHHDRLRLAFERLGRADLAEQEAAWLTRHREAREAQRKAREERRKQTREEANEGQ